MSDIRHWINLCESKIIAYHGRGTKIDSFPQPYFIPHYFTQDRDYAEVYSGKSTSSLIDKPKKTRPYLLTVELTINHMFDTKNDPEALAFYNEKFVPHENALLAKYKANNSKSIPLLEPGKYPSFVYADYLYGFFMGQYIDHPYDGMLIDEGITDEPAIIPFHATQIKILKREIIKPENRKFGIKDK